MRLNDSAQFLDLLACIRAGDLEKTSSLVENFSVELNCVDKYDYSPLILASLCGHINIVKYLLEHGAILERDTFDGARCLYGALNDEIRNLLLKYDATTSVDLLQPFAAHLTSLRRNNLPLDTSDITLLANEKAFQSHKFLLSARSPFFREQFRQDPKWTQNKHRSTKLAAPDNIVEVILKFIYVDNLDEELTVEAMKDLLLLADKLRLPALAEYFLSSISVDKRERQQVQSRLAQDDMEDYVRKEVIGQAWNIDGTYSEAVEKARKLLEQSPSIVADSLLLVPTQGDSYKAYAVHKSMLIKSEYYLTAFTSGFAETFEDTPVFMLETTPEVAEIVLIFLYVDRVEIPRNLALDVLRISSFLLLSKDRSLKSLAAIAVTNRDDELPSGTDVYAILRTAWETEAQRVEQYAAKYIAKHLDHYLHEAEFREIVEESAGRITNRQETDTIELIDDIRYYLSEAWGIYLEMNPADQRKRGESVKEDLWVPLTSYEVQYNEQLAKLEDLLESLALDA